MGRGEESKMDGSKGGRERVGKDIRERRGEN